MNNGKENSAELLPEPLSRLLTEGIKEGVFPGAAVGIVCGPPGARKQWQGFYGQRQLVPQPLPLTVDTSFDLASLSKPLATTMAIMALMEDGLLSLQSTLPELLGRDVPTDKKSINLRQLLAHCSGLVGHRPYFLHLQDIALASRKEEMLHSILSESLVAAPGKKAIYSDLGFMLLGFIVAEKSGLSLDRFVREKIYQPLSLEENMFFRALEMGWPQGKVVAATEECPWRSRVLQGEVSDDNSHVLGGVAGQAGLFADLAAVLTLTTHLLDCWQDRAVHPAFANDLLKSFFTKDGTVIGSSWALGFDTPSPQGSCAGKYFHPTSVGHLGFSGTSFWIDPSRDLVVVLLSNRIHPSRDNNKIKEFRPRFHDAVIEVLCS